MTTLEDLDYDIEQLYIEGMSAKRIAKQLNCPVSLVERWIKEQSVADQPQED